jgi:hypothetical protein
MSTLRTINVIHPSGTTNNIVNDASGNVTIGAGLTVTGTLTGSTGAMNIGSGQIYKDSSGNVGIGTSAPAYKLDVSGEIRATSNVRGTGSDQLYVIGGSTNANYMFIGGASSGTANTIAFTTNSSERARIDSSGNVGIGTSSPTYKLQVLAGYPGVGVYRDVDVTSSGPAGQGIEIGARNGSTPTPGASIIGALDNPATTGSLQFSTRTANSLTEKMRIDSSGNVGINCVPSAWGSYYKVIQSTAASTFCIVTQVNDIEVGTGYYNVDSGFSSIYNNTGLTKPSRYLQSNGVHIWNIANTGTTGNTISWTQAMTLDSSGNLLVGTTSQLGSATFTLVGSIGAYFRANGGAGNEPLNCHNTATSGTIYQITFRDGGSANSRGSITTNGTGTTYGTASDYRLKENVAPMNSGLATVAALKPVTYDWIGNKSQGEGFIAHELQEVIPHAVTGEKDAVDAEGNIIPQGVDYSKIVVHLVAACQELSAKNDALEARLAALESK